MSTIQLTHIDYKKREEGGGRIGEEREEGGERDEGGIGEEREEGGEREGGIREGRDGIVEERR